MNDNLGYDSALQGYTGLRITWTNEMIFVLNHAHSAGLISQAVNQQSSSLLQCYGCPPITLSITHTYQTVLHLPNSTSWSSVRMKMMLGRALRVRGDARRQWRLLPPTPSVVITTKTHIHQLSDDNDGILSYVDGHSSGMTTYTML